MGFYDCRADRLRLHKTGWFVNIPPVGGHLGGGGGGRGDWIVVANPSADFIREDYKMLFTCGKALCRSMDDSLTFCRTFV